MELFINDLNSKLCSYCYSVNSLQQQNCHCCEAPLNIERPFEIIIPEHDDYYTLDKVLSLNYNELISFNPYDLLMFLSVIRTCKKQLKLNESQPKDSTEFISLSRKGWLIENILYDKTSTYPARLKKAHFTEALGNNKRVFNAHKRRIEQAKRYL